MLGALHPARFFGDAFEEIDAEVRALDLSGPAHARARLRCLTALSLGAAMLACLAYGAGHANFRRLLRALDYYEPLSESGFLELGGYFWWSSMHVLGYVVVPALVMRIAFGVSLREQGLELGGTRQKLPLYALLFGLVSPVVIGASFLGEFSSYYPFYGESQRSWLDLAAWECLYMAQFFGLEFFFRGFLLAACRPVMGSSAIFCMIVPYCMIHFAKPMLEALGAIFAGLVLGTLALRTRSIWGGFLVHMGVAVTMDFAALLQGPGLPSRLWPPGW